MKQMNRALAIGAAVLLAIASAVSLAEAGHGFGGHGFGGHGSHGFGGRGFGGHGFHGFGGRGFAHHGFGGRGFAHHGYGGFSRHAFGSRSVHAFHGHGNHFANRQQHFSHFASHHEFGSHNRFAAHQFHNGFGNRHFAHNQFWGRRFGGNGFRHWHGNGFFWAGPVFWPFAYGDIFSFAFWPYYGPFWDYGPDFIFASLFWPYGGDDYASYEPYYGYGDIYTGYRRHHRANVATAESPTDVAEACSGVAPGLTGLPMDRIEKTLQPSGEQRASFDELKVASGKAEEIMKASCPSEKPLTPISRLDAVEKRVDAMIQAVQTLRAPLETFYTSLTDEQKRKLDSLANRGGHEQAGKTLAQLCSDTAARFTTLPSEQIQETVQPNEQQRTALEGLKTASTKAANILNGTCPSQTPSTPGDRLDAMAKRLDATAQAVNTVRPALQDFYASLTDEQKARFNTMDQQAQR